MSDSAAPLASSPSEPTANCPDGDPDCWLCRLKDEVRRAPHVSAARLPLQPPPINTEVECLICSRVKPWGIFDNRTGATVCVECRDKARCPSPSAETPLPDTGPLFTDEQVEALKRAAFAAHFRAFCACGHSSFGSPQPLCSLLRCVRIARSKIGEAPLASAPTTSRTLGDDPSNAVQTYRTATHVLLPLHRVPLDGPPTADTLCWCGHARRHHTNKSTEGEWGCAECLALRLNPHHYFEPDEPDSAAHYAGLRRSARFNRLSIHALTEHLAAAWEEATTAESSLQSERLARETAEQERDAETRRRRFMQRVGMFMGWGTTLEGDSAAVRVYGNVRSPNTAEMLSEALHDGTTEGCTRAECEAIDAAAVREDEIITEIEAEHERRNADIRAMQADLLASLAAPHPETRHE